MPAIFNRSNTGPLYSTHPADTFTLGGRRWPGLWKVTKASYALKEDAKQRAGKHRATTTFHGLKTDQPVAVGRIWTNEQWDLLQKIVADERRIMAGANAARQIDHPLLAICGTTAVQLVEIGEPKLSEKGLEITVKMRSWSHDDARNATVTNRTAPSRYKINAPPDIIERREAEAGRAVSQPAPERKSLPSKQPGAAGP